MAKLLLLAFMALFCTFASVALVNAVPDFVVEGRVYCDTCRAGFETNVTEYIAGAKVKLECRHFVNGNIEHNIDGVTDTTGKYRFIMTNSHEDEICEVVLVESPRPDCKEITPGRDRARAVLSQDTGITSNFRYPNSLGYLKDKPLDICGAIMKIYQLEDEY